MSITIGYYQLHEDFFGLVIKSFWDNNQHLDDSGSEKNFVPQGFYEVTSAIYEHTFASNEEAIAVLENAGWVQKTMFV